MAIEFQNVALEALHYKLGPEVWTSESVEERLAPLYERLRLPRGRLELMTGIRERRFWPEAVLPSRIAAQAAQGLLDKLHLNIEDIDLLIYCGVCRDQLEPATASSVHTLLKLSPNTQLFDLSNACLGFLDAWSVAAGLIEAGRIRRALIVSGEDGRPLFEDTLNVLNAGTLSRSAIKPYFANLTIGSGAVASTLAHKTLAPKESLKIQHDVSLSDTKNNHLCRGNGDTKGLYMETQSEEMLHLGIALAKRTWKAFMKKTGWTEKTPQSVVCHQVGKKHRDLLYKNLNLDLSKDFSTFAQLGNMGSAALPVSLAKALETGHAALSDPIALLGIGSGLVCRMMGLAPA